MFIKYCRNICKNLTNTELTP